MSFTKKTWKDRVVEYAGRRRLTPVSGSTTDFDVSRDAEGAITQAGDAFNATNMNNLETRIAEAFGALNAEMVDLMYPVGSIYISTKSTSPANLFGRGSWSRIQDRFLLAAGTTYGAGAQGGSATKNMSHYHQVNSHRHQVNSHSHYVYGHTLSISEMPRHDHYYGRLKKQSEGSPEGLGYNLTYNYGLNVWNDSGYTDYTGSGNAHDHGWTSSESPYTDYQSPTTTYAGATSQDIMPPYLTVYVWQRTA